MQHIYELIFYPRTLTSLSKIIYVMLEKILQLIMLNNNFPPIN